MLNISQATTAPTRAQAAQAPVEAPKTVLSVLRDVFHRRTRDAANFAPYVQDQGQTNGCGTTSLAMVLSFWKNKPGAVTRQDLDQQIRRLDMPTSPHNVADQARARGMRAELVNNASLGELASFVDKGVPVQVLFDPTGDASDTLLHYVVVTGMTRDAAGQITGIKYADPATGTMREMAAGEFTGRWQNLKVLGKDTGMSNLMIPMVPKNENVSFQGADGVTHKAGEIALPRGRGPDIRSTVFDRVTDAVVLADKAKDKVADASNWLKEKFWA